MKLLLAIMVSGLFVGCGGSDNEQVAFNSELEIKTYRKKQIVFEETGTTVDVKYDSSSRLLFLDTMVWLDDTSYTRGDSDESETLVRLDSFGIEIDRTETNTNGEVVSTVTIDPIYQNGRLVTARRIVRSSRNFEESTRFSYNEDGLLEGVEKFSGLLSADELMAIDVSEASNESVLTYDSLGRVTRRENYINNNEGVWTRWLRVDFEYIPEELKIVATQYDLNDDDLGRIIYIYEEGLCKDLIRSLSETAIEPANCGNVF